MPTWRPLLGWLAGLALASPPALAAEDRGAGDRELIGRVVKAEPRTVYLEHMGAIVAFEITRDTEFTGLGGSSSRDLAEGQQVLATFTVQGETTNVARRIAATSEAIAEPRSSSGPRGETSPPARPRDLPGPSDRGSRVPRAPPEQPVPRDPGVPLPR